MPFMGPDLEINSILFYSIHVVISLGTSKMNETYMECRFSIYLYIHVLAGGRKVTNSITYILFKMRLLVPFAICKCCVYAVFG